MSKKINTTSIGLFIVTGVTLGIIGLLLFSTSKLFSKSRDVIVYFNDSLNGLSEGAPFKYRGVTIGSVKRVMIRFDQATNDNSMPVILEIDDKLVRQRLGDEAGQLLYSSVTEAQRCPDQTRAARIASDREPCHWCPLRGPSDQSQRAPAGIPPA